MSILETNWIFLIEAGYLLQLPPFFRYIFLTIKQTDKFCEEVSCCKEHHAVKVCDMEVILLLCQKSFGVCYVLSQFWSLVKIDNVFGHVYLQLWAFFKNQIFGLYLHFNFLLSDSKKNLFCFLQTSFSNWELCLQPRVLWNYVMNANKYISGSLFYLNV